MIRLRLQQLREWWYRVTTQAAKRRQLLATPGVDSLVVFTMDGVYGKHHWDVTPEGVLIARVAGPSGVWWGTIGPLEDPATRAWLMKKRNGEL